MKNSTKTIIGATVSAIAGGLATHFLGGKTPKGTPTPAPTTPPPTEAGQPTP